MIKRVADIIMDTLIEYGIDNCFAVVGGVQCILKMHFWSRKK